MRMPPPSISSLRSSQSGRGRRGRSRGPRDPRQSDATVEASNVSASSSERSTASSAFSTQSAQEEYSNEIQDIKNVIRMLEGGGGGSNSGSGGGGGGGYRDGHRDRPASSRRSRSNGSLDSRGSGSRRNRSKQQHKQQHKTISNVSMELDLIKKAVLGLDEPTPKISQRMEEEAGDYDDEYKNGASFSSLLGPTLSPTAEEKFYDHSPTMVSPLMSPETTTKSKIPNDIQQQVNMIASELDVVLSPMPLSSPSPTPQRGKKKNGIKTNNSPEDIRKQETINLLSSLGSPTPMKQVHSTSLASPISALMRGGGERQQHVEENNDHDGSDDDDDDDQKIATKLDDIKKQPKRSISHTREGRSVVTSNSAIPARSENGFSNNEDISQQQNDETALPNVLSTESSSFVSQSISPVCEKRSDYRQQQRPTPPFGGAGRGVGRRQPSTGLAKLNLHHESNNNNTKPSKFHPKVSVHPEWSTSGSNLDAVMESPTPATNNTKPTLRNALSSEEASAENTETNTSFSSSERSALLINIDGGVNSNKEEFLKAQRLLMEAAMNFSKLATNDQGGIQQQQGRVHFNEKDTLYKKIWDTTFDCIAVTDDVGIIKYVNPTMVLEFGYDDDPSQIIGQDVSLFAGGGEEDPSGENNNFNRRKGRIGSELGKVEVVHSRRKDGSNFVSLVGAQKCLLPKEGVDVIPISKQTPEERKKELDGALNWLRNGGNKDEKTKQDEAGDGGDHGHDLVFFIRNVSNCTNHPKLAKESGVVKQQRKQIESLQKRVQELENQMENHDKETNEVISGLESKVIESEMNLKYQSELVTSIMDALDVDDEEMILDELDNIFKRYEKKAQECKVAKDTLEKQIKNHSIYLSENEQQQQQQQQQEQAIRSIDETNELSSSSKHGDLAQIEQLSITNEKLLKDNQAMQKYIDTLEDETITLTTKLDEITKTNEDLEETVQQIQEEAEEEKARLLLENAKRQHDNDDDAFMEEIADSAIMTDSDGIILRVNAGTLNLFGYKKKDDLIGKDLLDLFSEKVHKKFTEEFITIARGEKPSKTVPLLFGYRKDGKELPLSLSLSSASATNNTMVGIIRDMSALRGKTIPFESGKYKASKKGIPISMYITENAEV